MGSRATLITASLFGDSLSRVESIILSGYLVFIVLVYIYRNETDSTSNWNKSYFKVQKMRKTRAEPAQAMAYSENYMSVKKVANCQDKLHNVKTVMRKLRKLLESCKKVVRKL